MVFGYTCGGIIYLVKWCLNVKFNGGEANYEWRVLPGSPPPAACKTFKRESSLLLIEATKLHKTDRRLQFSPKFLS